MIYIKRKNTFDVYKEIFCIDYIILIYVYYLHSKYKLKGVRVISVH